MDLMNVLESKMKNADERLNVLTQQVVNILPEDEEKVEINDLLHSVNQVKDSYQCLRKDLIEVQNLQKELSSSLQMQLKVMQLNFNSLKEKLRMTESNNEQSVDYNDEDYQVQIREV